MSGDWKDAKMLSCLQMHQEFQLRGLAAADAGGVGAADAAVASAAGAGPALELSTTNVIAMNIVYQPMWQSCDP